MSEEKDPQESAADRLEAIARRYERLGCEDRARIVRGWIAKPDPPVDFLAGLCAEAEQKHHARQETQGAPITDRKNFVESYGELLSILLNMTGHKFKTPLAELLPETEAAYYLRYHNQIAQWCNERGFYVSDWLKGQSYGRIFTLPGLFNLVRERDRKRSKNVHYKPQRLVRYEKEFKLRVVQQDKRGWEAYERQMQELGAKARVERKVKKKVEKVKQKAEKKFPLFAEQIVREETAKIRKEESDKLKPD
jgi:hypothetical protein